MEKWRNGALFLGLALFFGCALLASGVLAQEGTPPEFADPVVYGAWLYEGNCVRCHGASEQERIGRAKTRDVLARQIEAEGCEVRWGRRYGGPMTSKEIRALVAYIMAWEEQGASPITGPLPPQPTATPTPTRPAAQAQPTPTPTAAFARVMMDARIKHIAQGNALAYGAWLYTQYCHRCHQSYGETRQGRGKREADLLHVIQNGKTSTQMKPFARTKGGGRSQPRNCSNCLLHHGVGAAEQSAGAAHRSAGPADARPSGATADPATGDVGVRGRCHPG